MPQTYTPEFRKKIVRLREEEGRTYKSITAEYGVSKASISKWCREFSKECQEKVSPSSEPEPDRLPPLSPHFTFRFLLHILEARCVFAFGGNPLRSSGT
ncbi:MAG: transposase [Candidatus Limivivens sp.]|nr:transposase [Candidatus Limivivens sp.]